MGTSEQQSERSLFYVGRFAPSPTAQLHFGSLIAATASYLCAKQQHGKWLLRIEDVDTQRSHAKDATIIISSLEQFGFQWDDEIIFQSKRFEQYEAVLESIKTHTYPCSCTRKQLRALMAQATTSNNIYPGLCRQKPLNPASRQFNIRLKTANKTVCFEDLCQTLKTKPFCQNIGQKVGDFILKRSDSDFSYQLAVVVDDMNQGITHIVRGADLLESTPRQIYLQRLLGYSTPEYLHFPIAITATGEKLSKRNQSTAITLKYKRLQLTKALSFLGQSPPPHSDFEDLNDLWFWAIQNWDISLIPRKKEIRYE